MNSYIFQDEDNSDKWSYVKVDLIKNEVNNEDVKTEQNVNTIQD